MLPLRRRSGAARLRISASPGGFTRAHTHARRARTRVCVYTAVRQTAMPPSVRLVLYQGASEYELTSIHSAYIIQHVEDARSKAFSWSSKLWLAIALEVDGALQKFQGSEHVVMKVRARRALRCGGQRAALMRRRVAPTCGHYQRPVAADRIADRAATPADALLSIWAISSILACCCWHYWSFTVSIRH